MKSKPIQIEFTGEEISGYRKVKEASYVPILNVGWVKETEDKYILPSKLSLVILNAVSQGYHWEIDVISVHSDIFREELEIIDGCEIEFPFKEERRPKIRLVKTEIAVNLKVAQSPKLKKSLPVIKQFNNTIRNLDAGPIDVVFLHFKLITLGNAVKSRSKSAKEELEKYRDYTESSQEIKNLRHHYLLGPNSYWNSIPLKDPQNALYDDLMFWEERPKSALIYGTPRFINKGYSKQDLKLFHSLKSGISLPAKEETEDFLEKYCKRLAYLLNLYGFEKTYIADPYFQYGFKFYSQLFTRYFEIEMM